MMRTGLVGRLLILFGLGCVALTLPLRPGYAAAAKKDTSRGRDGFNTPAAVKKNYVLKGRVRHDERRRRMVFGGSGWVATKRPFSNHVEVAGRVLVPGAINTTRDEIGLLLRHRRKNTNYGVSLVYGREHPATGSLTIVRNGMIVARTHIEIKRGVWYRLYARTDGLRITAEARPLDVPDSPVSRLTYPLDGQWRAGGGIGFAHVGRGTAVDDLAITELGHLAPEQALRQLLPRPVLDARPTFVALYWKAWEIALTKVRYGTAANGFVPTWLDEGAGPSLYQWDTCFMTMFAVYAQGALPGIESLDNFYRKQHADGFICRELRERDGRDAVARGADDAINPPLFAWAEWRYYRLTGDGSRLGSVLWVLSRYYDWIAVNRQGVAGLPRQTNAGSGMFNSPRYGSGWVDLAAQQAHTALTLYWIAAQLGDIRTQYKYAREYMRLRDAIERACWHETDGLYYDLDETGEQVRIKTPAAFWPMLARVPGPERVERLISHMNSRDEFLRSHRVPSLSAEHADYDPAGGSWRGAVWAPTNFMIVKGLEACGRHDEARLIALNHLTMMAQVFSDTGTIWENYAPDRAAPGSPAKRDFVGWSGCGPIALLIENVLGLHADGAADTLTWRIREPGRHGIDNFRFGDNTVTLICEAPASPAGQRTITVLTTSPFVLVLDTPTGRMVRRITARTTRFQIVTTAPRPQ